jgi:hypothetical protein
MNMRKNLRFHSAGEKTGDAGITPDRPRISGAEPAPIEQFVLFAPLMLLGMFGAASSFYSVFRVNIDAGSMMVFIAGVSVGSTALFISKRRRAILLIVLGVIAAVCLLTWERLRTLIAQGVVDVVNTVIFTYESKANVDLSLIPVDEISEDEIRLSTTVLIMSLLLFVTLAMGWLLVRRRSAFFSFLLTLPFPSVAFAYTIIPDFRALMAIGLYWLFLLLFIAPLRVHDGFRKKRSRRAGARHIYIDGGRLPVRFPALVIIPVLALCLLLTANIFSIESYERPRVSDDLRDGVVNGNIGLAIFNSGGVAGNTNRVDLRYAGNLHHSNETMIRVKSTKSTPDYLKGFVGSVYTGTGWEQLPEASQEELTEIEGGVKPQNYAATMFQLFESGMESESEHPYELTVENVNINPHCVYTPYGLSSTPGALAEIEFVSDGFLRSSNNMFGLRDYTLKSVYVSPEGAYMDIPEYDEMPRFFIEWLSPEQRSFFENQSRYNAFVYEQYTELPDGLKTRLNDYLDERGLDPANYYVDNTWALSSDAGDARTSVQSFLSANFALDVVRQVQSENAYTRNPGATPEGRDFVEYFLTENHKGYCVHFATAVAALLRSVGIPARYAEGFVVSPDDPKTNDGWTELPDTRAHAWVEIYVKGVGWMPVEATPGRQSGVTIPWDASAIGIPESETPTPVIDDTTSAGATSGGAASATSGAVSGDDESASGGGIAGGATGSSSDSFTGGVLGKDGILGSPITWIIVAAMLSMIFTARVVRRRRVSKRERSFEDEDRRKAALAAYAYIVNLSIFTEGEKISGEALDSVLPPDLMDIVTEARFSRREPSQDALDKLLAYAGELSARAERDAPPLRRLCGKYVYGLF